jgi:protein-S-isoprenylcysteine O-methyltransferase Ste14
MIHSIIATTFVVATMAVSAYFYNHRGRMYAQGKSEQIPALPGFSVAYRWVQVTTFACSVGSFWSLSPVLLKVFNSVSLLYLGLSVGSIAIILFVWAKVTLNTEYSPCFDSFVATKLITSGPYSRVRHPIYSANLLLLCGIFLASGSLWIALNVIVVAVYYAVSARREEAALMRAIPEYLTYAKRTGRFIPKLLSA